ncbi:TPA: fimbria/pilus chaperone family protein [Klebsiella quasipneumoniae subsp. similipneumoniae]
MFISTLRFSLPGLCLLLSCGVNATGMVPESSVVIIEEQNGEGTMNVTNTDSLPMLLTTTVQGIIQDDEKLLLVSPPAIRVDAGKTQKVRFILASKQPLKTERLRRVIFSGIPPQNKGKNEVRMSVSQNLPVLIRPANLPKEETPWKRLSWKVTGGSLLVSNDSPYVVRLAQGVKALPEGTDLTLPQSYILPGEHLTLTPSMGQTLGNPSQVQISPATTWGYSVDTYLATVTH